MGRFSAFPQDVLGSDAVLGYLGNGLHWCNRRCELDNTVRPLSRSPVRFVAEAVVWMTDSTSPTLSF